MVRPSTINKLDDPLDCCCPASGCVLCNSNFSYAGDSTTDIGDCPEEISGDWWLIDIDGDPFLKEMGNSGALAISSIANSVNQDVDATILCESGTKHRIIVNYEDPSKYYFVEIDAAAGVITLNSSTAGQLASMTTGCGEDAEMSLKVCITEYGVFAVDYDGQILYVCLGIGNVFAGGTKAGVGNGGSVAIHFSEFTFRIHHLDLEVCDFCVCTCAEPQPGDRPILHCVPLILYVTLYDLGGCPDLDGKTFTGVWDRNQAVSTISEWVTEEYFCSLPKESASCFLHFNIVCNYSEYNDDCTKWRLQDVANSGCWRNPEYANPWGAPPDICSCNPFSMTFPAFCINIDGPDCCDDSDPDNCFYPVVTI